ncbi:urate hydroxylase PuuD [Bdellovibrionota bacterium FG-1]
MDIALFSMDGVTFLFRWFHLFFGIVWIGLLYYFNFVQGAFMAEADGPTKSMVIQKLLPRALAWFRWGAMFTMITGVLYLGIRGHLDGHAIYATPWGIAILTGAAFGLTMWANVWFIIWPNQKVVIRSAAQVASGGTALPEAPACGARALLASRTNVLFSIPMLFFMGAASHLPIHIGETAHLMNVAIAVLVVIGLLELNALKGKLGPLTKVGGVIHMGFLLTVLTYGLVEVLTK